MYKDKTYKVSKNKTVAGKTKSQLLRENKVGKEKEYRAKPVFEDQFKMAKFKNSGAPRINTNISAFQNAAKQSLEVQNNAE